MSILRKVSAFAGAAIIGAAMLAGTASAQTPPTVTLSPSGPYVDQQTITVSVGPNSVFPPNQSVKILECAVGATSDAQCDGNTQNEDTIVTAADGSFSYNAMQVWVLPNAALGEPAGNHPVCNATTPCELYVGLNQNDFTQPKVFSDPFTVGANEQVPETPYLPFLPIGAVVILGGGYVVLRRRSNRATHIS